MGNFYKHFDDIMFLVSMYVTWGGLPTLLIYGVYIDDRLKKENAKKKKVFMTYLLFCVIAILWFVYAAIFLGWFFMQFGDSR